MDYFVVAKTTRDTAMAKSGTVVAIYGPYFKEIAIRNWKMYVNSTYGKSEQYPFVAQIVKAFGPEEKDS